MSRALPYGPTPWPQTFWDGRAAANFVCGGMGAGLVVASALAGGGGAALAVPLLAGLVLVGCGLLAVFAEIGRPLRSANVVLNPRSSWMSREALVAPLLFASGALAAAGVTGFAMLAALLALAYAACQGRMLGASRGIPAWRAPAVPWLLPATGVAEGLGLWLAIAAFTQAPSSVVAALLGVAVIVRLVVFRVYRRALGTTLAPEAARALDAAGRVLLVAGTLAVLGLLALAVALPPSAWSRGLALAAGLAAAASGAWLKAAIVLRAGHTQGCALPALPVRGVPPPGG